MNKIKKANPFSSHTRTKMQQQQYKMRLYGMAAYIGRQRERLRLMGRQLVMRLKDEVGRHCLRLDVLHPPPCSPSLSALPSKLLTLPSCSPTLKYGNSYRKIGGEGGYRHII